MSSRIPARRAWLGAVLAGAPLLVAICLTCWGWIVLQRPFRAWEGAELVLKLPRGARGHDILARLEAAGVVPNAGFARLYLLWILGDPPLKAGVYAFDEALTTPDVLARLVRGEVSTELVTIVEGLTLEETAQALSAAGFGDRQRLLAAMSDPSPILHLDPQARSLEGYLFPDTYAFAHGLRAEQLVAALVENFQSQLRGPLAGLVESKRLRQVVTLASIVEKETSRDEERALVAGVFANRLRLGMPLQADPTVIYALKRVGTWDGNLRRADLRLESAYNTYVHAGLPPGPICSPGRGSLEAAAAPAETSHLYFVSRNDGSHVFADTLAEHNRNVRRWQR